MLVIDSAGVWAGPMGEIFTFLQWKRVKAKTIEIQRRFTPILMNAHAQSQARYNCACTLAGLA